MLDDGYSKVSPQLVDIDKETEYWRRRGGAPALCGRALTHDAFVALIRFSYDGYLKYGTGEINAARPLLMARYSGRGLQGLFSWGQAELACEAVWARMKSLR